MKCPKCGYLGFEQAERCRNCGYDFALTTPRPTPDLSLREAERDLRAFDDLELIDAAAPQHEASAGASTILASAVSARTASDMGELPLFGDDAPLITKASPPRPPLAVRRATPDPPRLRTERARTTSFEFQEAELEMPLEVPVSPAVRASAPEWSAVGAGTEQLAGLGARFVAAAIDLLLLALVDMAVVYLTVQICGLGPDELSLLPIGPLIAFLVVQNGGYLVAFTAGGQTIGKMLVGIRVVPAQRGETLDLGRSLVRTMIWSVLALPIGLGLFTALFSKERRGFHDRLAGTKVIRSVPA